MLPYELSFILIYIFLLQWVEKRPSTVGWLKRCTSERQPGPWCKINERIVLQKKEWWWWLFGRFVSFFSVLNELVFWLEFSICAHSFADPGAGQLKQTSAWVQPRILVNFGQNFAERVRLAPDNNTPSCTERLTRPFLKNRLTSQTLDITHTLH